MEALPRNTVPSRQPRGQGVPADLAALTLGRNMRWWASGGEKAETRAGGGWLQRVAGKYAASRNDDMRGDSAMILVGAGTGCFWSL